jgi:uncharacterized damage-inducible protein DinB
MFAEMILPEFDQEMATTLRVLERVPSELLDWRPHSKSNTIGWNANHLAEIPGWVENVLTEPSFDINPPGGPVFATPTHASREAILAEFDRNVAQARAAIMSFKDEAIDEIWSFLDNGQTLFAMPRGVVMRTFILSHIIHHRAILSVYYRLNDIPVPAIYGPSADEAE